MMVFRVSLGTCVIAERTSSGVEREEQPPGLNENATSLSYVTTSQGVVNRAKRAPRRINCRGTQTFDAIAANVGKSCFNAKHSNHQGTKPGTWYIYA